MKKNHNLWHIMTLQLLDVVVSSSAAALVIEADKRRPPFSPIHRFLFRRNLRYNRGHL